MPARHAPVLAFVVILVAACPPKPPSSGGDDAGASQATDAGPADASVATDAAWTDADVPPDAGEDAGAPSPDAGEVDAGPPDAGSGPTPVRVMAANLSSGNNQTYDPGEGIRIMQGLHADVILIQEFNYDPNGDHVYTPAEIQALVVAACGAGCFHAREPGSGPTMIPNGIISRFPVLSSGQEVDPQQTNRSFAWALLDLPGPRDLWAVSVHLSTTLGKRTLSATALATFLETLVPAGDLLVLGGDFNTDTEREQPILNLDDMFETEVMPADQQGSRMTSGNRSKPYDRVLPNDALEAYRVPVVIGSASYPDGLVFDSRLYTPLSDVDPVRVGDSGATGMQHMAVLKDFVVP